MMKSLIFTVFVGLVVASSLALSPDVSKDLPTEPSTNETGTTESVEASVTGSTLLPSIGVPATHEARIAAKANESESESTTAVPSTKPPPVSTGQGPSTTPDEDPTVGLLPPVTDGPPTVHQGNAVRTLENIIAAPYYLNGKFRELPRAMVQIP